MKALILENPFSFQFAEKDLDDDLKPDEALIKIQKIGICGTDYHAFRGKQPFFSYPRILGHELGAEVVKIGSNTEGVADSKFLISNSNISAHEIWNLKSEIKIGDKVSLEPYLNCGTCQPCRNGKSNCCEDLQVMGVHVDGGMTEYLKVPIRKLHRSKKLNFEQLALVETLSIGSHAVQRANVSAHDLILVIGAGPIGLSVIQFAKLAGATIAVLDTNTQRLDFAKNAFQTDISIELKDDFSPEILRAIEIPTKSGRRGYLKGDLPTIVFDATGNPNSMHNAFNYIAFGAKLVFVGLFIGDVTFHDPLFHRKEITLLASRNSLPEDFKKMIQLMESGKIDTTAWLTHRADFDALPKVFNQWLDPTNGVIKAMVSM
jgi:2-desacetyl-2-hydroxyethyl bacteriochlorophyllide A dehydrogenase